MSFDSRAVRKKTRPMRPNPLTPTRVLIRGLLVGTTDRRSRQLGPNYTAAQRLGRARAREPSRPDGHLEPSRDALGEEGRLIEAAFPFPIAGERHGDDRGDPVAERRAALLDGQVSQRPGQRPPAAELEPM